MSKYSIGHDRMTPPMHRIRTGLLDIIDACNGDKTKHTEKKFAERALVDFDIMYGFFEAHDDLTQVHEDKLQKMDIMEAIFKQQEADKEEAAQKAKDDALERTQKLNTIRTIGSIIVIGITIVGAVHAIM